MQSNGTVALRTEDFFWFSQVLQEYHEQAVQVLGEALAQQMLTHSALKVQITSGEYFYVGFTEYLFGRCLSFLLLCAYCKRFFAESVSACGIVWQTIQKPSEAVCLWWKVVVSSPVRPWRRLLP